MTDLTRHATRVSADQIPALRNAALGFRHGPKSRITPETDLWRLRSAAPPTRACDTDLRAHLRTRFPRSRITAPDIRQPATDLWSAPLRVALAQHLAMTWSDRQGLDVDDGAAGEGGRARVVQGVNLHRVMP